MLLDSAAPAPARRRLRSTSERLVEALKSLAGGHGDLAAHHEAAWASITFSGKRHTLRLIFDGAEAADAGERLIEALPDHEFAIPGQLVADATVRAVDHRLLPEERLEATIEVLLLDDR